MSTVTPTLIPRPPALPLLLPSVPTPHPTPLPPRFVPGKGLNSRRSLRTELEELSDEEEKVETQWKETIQARGFNHLRIIGRLLTRQEEKNDQAESDSDESGSAHSGDQVSAANDGENASEQEQETEQDLDRELDLDASMDDLDDTDARNATFEDSEAELDLDMDDNESEL
ncbi:hypothetical protein EW145_g282 [Phellinidium pouzarii]|uniref:Uncharacterized protein n=1 Tax=Phellinidium pouzarii TaxID=167371 RepID=A0A4S4LPI1_9AGAM|nr:hypothetical protein EW145_g282 [Phellinidium pouzarii]